MVLLLKNFNIRKFKLSLSCKFYPANLLHMTDYMSPLDLVIIDLSNCLLQNYSCCHMMKIHETEISN